jgi:WD40 repeat protein
MMQIYYAYTDDLQCQANNNTTVGHLSRIAYREDGKYFITATSFGNIILWDVYKGMPLKIFNPEGEIVYGPDISSTSTLTTSQIFQLLKKGYCDVKFVAASPCILLGKKDGNGILYCLESNKILFHIVDKLSINSTDISPDGNNIITSNWRCSSIPVPGLVKIWNVKTGKRIGMIMKFMTTVDKISYSHNGTMFFILGPDEISIWQSDGRRELLNINVKNNRIRDACYSPDDKYLLTGGDSGDLTLWDINTGNKIKEINIFHESINQVGISPDGKFLAAASQNEGVKIWNIESQKETLIKKNNILYIQFSSDNNYIFLSDICKEAYLFNVNTLELFKQFKLH